MRLAEATASADLEFPRQTGFNVAELTHNEVLLRPCARVGKEVVKVLREDVKKASTDAAHPAAAPSFDMVLEVAGPAVAAFSEADARPR